MTKKVRDRVLAIESILIELMLRDSNDPATYPWSSRVQAERIYGLAHDVPTETVKKPWEHFASRENELTLEKIDSVWTNGTHIVFRNMGPTPVGKTRWTKTNIYEVTAKADNFPLGRIAWFGRWRKYTFQPSSDCVFEETCMREISLFIQQETRLQMKRAAEKRKAAKA